MDDLEQLREKIDEIDELILNALSERTKVCRAIGLVKKKRGMQIRDNARENEVYMHVKEKAAKFQLDSLQVEAVYQRIVNMCSAVQE